MGVRRVQGGRPTRRHGTSVLLAVALAASACSAADETTRPPDEEPLEEAGSPGGEEPDDEAIARAPEMTTVTYGSQGGIGYSTGLWVALGEELGFFDEANIAPDMITVTSGPDAINGLISGEIQLNIMGSEGFIAADRGADVISVATVTDTSQFLNLATSEIGSWDDLDGRTAGLSGLDTIPALFFRRTIEQFGYADGDIDYVVVGGTTQRQAALEAGQIDVAPVSMPAAFYLEQEGYTNLGVAPEGQEPETIINVEFNTSRSWAEENPEVLRAFLHAYKRTLDWVRDPANRDDLVERVIAINEDDEEAARATLDFYFFDPPTDLFFPEDMRHHPDAFATTLQAYQELGSIPEGSTLSEDDYIDYSYLPEG